MIAPALSTSPREAGAAFLRGTASGWGRRDLALWLVCHYAPATRASSDAATQPGPRLVVDEDTLEQVVLDARSRTLTLLSDLAFASLAAPRARGLIAAGAVAADHGAYVPVSLSRMRLADRVASLFVADWLNDPAGYQKITHCRACGAIAFRPPIAHALFCAASALRPRAPFSRASA